METRIPRCKHGLRPDNCAMCLEYGDYEPVDVVINERGYNNLAALGEDVCTYEQRDYEDEYDPNWDL
jgi:hypothetical protein